MDGPDLCLDTLKEIWVNSPGGDDDPSMFVLGERDYKRIAAEEFHAPVTLHRFALPETSALVVWSKTIPAGGYMYFRDVNKGFGWMTLDLRLTRALEGLSSWRKEDEQ
jgi:hypothetical protein